MFGWQRKKLEKKRAEAISSITGDKIKIEMMAQRARISEDPMDFELLQTVLDNIARIEAAARASSTVLELDDLIADGELQGLASAYFCPAGEVRDEAVRLIDNLEIWGVPSSSLKKLRDRFMPRLDAASESPSDARSALHGIFIEVDEWGDYKDDYEETMWSYTQRLFWGTAFLLAAGGLCFYFAHIWPILIWFGLIVAGAAGSCASIMAKMPSFDLSLSGELDTNRRTTELDGYRRRILSRMAAGMIGSLIGVALLGWGVLPISIKDQAFTDALSACATRGVESGSMTKALIVLGVAMLLGFSERTLTSFEQRLFSDREFDPSKVNRKRLRA